jgi:dTDP-glucose pyrophosphorylase
VRFTYTRHIIATDTLIRDCLKQLNELANDAILFVTNNEKKLIGSLTDGDIRRGLLKGFTIDDRVENFLQENPKYIQRGNYNIEQIIEYREAGFRILPLVDKNGLVINVINFRNVKSYLPVDTLIMAGGRGERLLPLTETTPKPLLKVGDKPIILHNLDRLISFGIDDFWISVKYLGSQIVDFIGDGHEKGISIKYIHEEIPLGTIGSISLIPEFEHDHILVTNSDLLTNLDYEKFFIDFVNSGADMAIATIPYNVNIPYAIIETNLNVITNFQEKPTYTYFANAGIYLFKKDVVQLVPKETYFNATDLLNLLIKKNKKVISFPLRGYWLDIGKHEDYKKANEDIKFINF